VRTQTGKLISDPAVVGGWGALAGGPAPVDTDQDGMPNLWETARGLNPNDAADRNLTGLFGYTRLEVYLNELGGAHTQKVWRAASGTWSTASTWTSPGVPTDDDTALVRGNAGAAGLAIIDAPGANAWDVRIGGEGEASLSVASGGSLRVKNTLLVGDAGAGFLNIDGGIVEAKNVVIGSFGYSGAIVVQGGGVLRSAFVGRDGAGGGITLSGATIAALDDLTVSAPINLAADGTIDTAGHDATISSVVSGPAPWARLIKSGPGVLTLSAANSYVGGTKLAGGTLSIGSSANIGGVGSPIEFAGGTLRVTGAALANLNGHAVNWTSFDGGIDVDAAGHTMTISQALQGTGTLTKRGAGTLVLSATNDHGGVVAAGGVLSVVDDLQLGAPAAPLGLAGGALRLTTSGASSIARVTTLSGASTIEVSQGSGVVTLGQAIGGGGSITKAGAGTLILAAANTYTGGTTVSAGTLRISHPLALQNSTVTLNGGTLDLNSLAASVGGLAGTGAVDLRGQVLTLGGSNQNSTFAGNIVSSTGVASVEKVGSGTVNLSGANTYTGGTVLRGGALGITTDANIGGSTSAVTFAGGLLRINGTTLSSMGSHAVNWSTFDGGFDVDSAGHAFTVSQAIGGSGAMIKRGAGRLVLSNTSNSYTGGTRLEGGAVEISSLSNIGGTSSAITFAGGILRTTASAVASLAANNVNWSTFDGGFDVSNSGSMLVLTNPIGGSGSLTKLGAGTLRMDVANSYTGDTRLNAGTLVVLHPDALLQTNLVPGGGALAVTVTNVVNLGGMKGSGALALGSFALNVGGNGQDTTYSGVLSSSSPQGAITKVGSGTLTLSGASSFTKPLVIKEGAISVSSMAASGANSPLGTGASAAALVLDGGKLVYNGGSGGSTNRLFTVTANGGTIECGGAGALTLSGTGSIAQSGAGDRTLTLMGVNSDCAFSFALGDPASGKTSLRKDEGGRWIMNGAAGTLTYSGDTVIDAGILLINGNVRLPFGAGKGNLVINAGQFEMNGRDMQINGLYGAGNIQNRTSTRTLTLGNANANGDFSGVVSNTGGGSSTQLLNVTKVGAGTQIFRGFNTYGGLTDVQAGTLVMGSHAAAGFSSILVSGGLLRVDPGANAALQLFKTVAIGGTLVAPTGTIDVASGGFIASKAAGNSLSTLLAWQQAGMVQNAGGGLTSSWVASHAAYGLAIVDNAVLGLTSLHGRDVTADSLLVAPARLGDANLDGAVDGADLARIRSRFGAPGGATWADGDFTMDGAVNGADFVLWQRWLGSGAMLASANAPVPEPSAWLLCAMAAVGGALARRPRLGAVDRA
ncbi:MAG TPA: autotransporter-associated beta strand repeat-containing protein, partial [Lacipirellulaceae bacterium]|nr:autotransporter-associated beta strand repeat-containing protein [Lacipirellulaceae bacterium]